MTQSWLTCGQSTFLRFQIYLCVHVCSAEARVAEPSPNSVYIHASTKQMCCSRMSNEVRAHPLLSKGRFRDAGFLRGSLHKCVYTKPRQWLPTSVQEQFLSLITA